MPIILTAANLRTFFEAHPSTYKPSIDQQPDVQADGYLATPHIYNLLTGSYGTVANPAPAPQIPQPVTFAALAAACPLALATVPDADIAPIQAKLDAHDNAGLVNWAVLLNVRTIAGSKIMSDGEKAAVIALCSQTMADPAWPASVPAPSVMESEFGGSVAHDELIVLIQIALRR